jgi:DNA gyrase/topoisomerase IV subunit B
MRKVSNLTRLKGSERIRKRVGVMMGSDDIQGVQQTLFEIISNSIDRFRKGHGNFIKITKHTDLSYTVEDFADGLPMEWNQKENAYNWDLALKVLYAGDNYNADSKALGLNGLGLCSSQYASEYMTVISYRDGKRYTVKCKKGRPIHKDTGEFICEDDDNLFTKRQGEMVLKVEDSVLYNESSRTGTIIKYRPDLEVFTDINISIEWINQKCKKQAMVNKGLKIEVFDEENNQSYIHFYENGIKDYIAEISNDKNFTDIILFSDGGRGRDIEGKDEYDYEYEIALVFNNEINQLEHYHNSSELLHGGSTAQAIESALTNVVNEHIKKNNLAKKDDGKIKFSDIQDSLICVISSFSTSTSYANQTKLAINNEFIKSFTTESLKEKLKVYFIENNLEAEKIINQILINLRARSKAEQTRLDIKKKLEVKNKGLSPKIEGLKDCDMKNSTLEERILLLNEGISANSTITQAIDSRTMGSYPLRGRFISSLKNSVTDVLNNKPALGIIQALGCGIEIPSDERKKFKDLKTFDINDLRYGMVGILCDRDAFGRGINLSLITFFYKFMPQLLKDGRIYLIKSPRYEITTKDGMYFVYNEKEKLELEKKLSREKIKYSIGIKKGLGEFNKEEFYEYVLSPEKRKFVQIEYLPNEEKMIEYYFNVLMGEDIENRKKYIKENVITVKLEDIDC